MLAIKNIVRYGGEEIQFLTFKLFDMMDFYVFRHGQTDNNHKRIWQGCQINIDLNPTGIGQAQQLARQLKEKKLKAVVSSPLIRARHTGKIVAEACGIPLLIRENLHEAHYGLAEGLTFDEVQNRWPAVFEKWIRPDRENFGIRFEGGESQQEVLNRIFAVFDDLARTRQYDCVGISIHGGTIALLLAYLGVSCPRIENGGFIHICRSDDGKYALL